jgi:hypothetical protein
MAADPHEKAELPAPAPEDDHPCPRQRLEGRVLGHAHVVSFRRSKAPCCASVSAHYPYSGHGFLRGGDRVGPVRLPLGRVPGKRELRALRLIPVGESLEEPSWARSRGKCPGFATGVLRLGTGGRPTSMGWPIPSHHALPFLSGELSMEWVGTLVRSEKAPLQVPSRRSGGYPYPGIHARRPWGTASGRVPEDATGGGVGGVSSRGGEERGAGSIGSSAGKKSLRVVPWTELGSRANTAGKGRASMARSGFQGRFGPLGFGLLGLFARGAPGPPT